MDGPTDIMTIYDANPLDIINGFTTAETKVFNTLKKMRDEQVAYDLWWHWKLGKEIRKLWEVEGTAQSKYGSHFIERLAVSLGYKACTQLRNAMTVAEQFCTERAFRDLVNMRGPFGNPLYWSHIVILCSIPNKDTMQEMIEAVLNENLTVDELRKRVRLFRGISPVNAIIRIPRTAWGCLSHMKTTATKVSGMFRDTWMSPRFNLAGAVDELPVDQLNTKFFDNVASTIVALRDLRAQVGTAEETLETIARNLANKLDVPVLEQLAPSDEDDPGDFDDAENEPDINMAEWKRQQKKPVKKKKTKTAKKKIKKKTKKKAKKRGISSDS